LLLIVVQALGRTQISGDSPTVNGENLLVLTVPLVLMYGAGAFFQIMDQMTLRYRELRYLTPQTMDSRFLSQWVRSGEHSWPSFILLSMLRSYIPGSFPLRSAPQGFFPEQLFLTDDDRWSASNSGDRTSGP
jgi:hypothetical protein